MRIRALFQQHPLDDHGLRVRLTLPYQCLSVSTPPMVALQLYRDNNTELNVDSKIT